MAKVTIEPIVGRYAHMEVRGKKYRMYYEEAGQGIPLILGHTAGADGREYRRILNDPNVTSRFRCIAFDLPFHGKSLPPEDHAWWAEQYDMYTEDMLAWPNAIVDAFELENPVYMGMSMGGHLAIDICLHTPEKFMACIGLEGALRTDDEYASCGLEGVRWEFDNPQIGTSELGAAMYLNMNPNSPYENIKEVSWLYNCAGPGIFAGDLTYYNEDHHVTDEQAKSIDVSKCMLYLMNGEYDPNTTVDEGQEIADLIPGCEYTAMMGLGHFPVCEDYETFKKYFYPVLDKVVALAESKKADK